MSKGTVLYVGAFELPDKNAAAHRVLSNGKIFRDLGYRVVFIDVDKSLGYNSDILMTSKNVEGFECWSIPYPQKKFEWMHYLSNIDYMNLMMGKYKDIKVIVAYNYPALALNNLRKYSKLNNCKIISDCTEWYNTKGMNIIFKIIKGLDSFFRMRILNKRLDGLIVISKFLEDYYINCDNVVRIPPLIDINETKWGACIQENEDIYTHSNKIRFVYSGSPGKNKDKIVNIVQAFYNLKEFNNYEINIIGISREQFIEDNPDFVDKISVLENRIQFLGRISHQLSISEIKKADYSIFIREKSRTNMAGFPTKFVESITCATPVITNDCSDIKEYFVDYKCGILLRNSSVESVQETLEKYILNNGNFKENYKEINNKIFHYSKYIDVIETSLKL